MQQTNNNDIKDATSQEQSDKEETPPACFAPSIFLKNGTIVIYVRLCVLQRIGKTLIA